MKPKSYNNWKLDARGARYQEALINAFKKVYDQYVPLSTNLYGLVYHFYKSDIGIDADNLSKPVWDCMKGVLFDDDKRVKLRVAGSFDLSDDYLGSVESSGLPGRLVADLLVAVGTQEHVLYIECGLLSPEMILLNITRYANQA